MNVYRAHKVLILQYFLMGGQQDLVFYLLKTLKQYQTQ